jgi:hypothetical protein
LLRNTEKVWCRRGDSNPHELPHTPLKRARLPIPPLRLVREECQTDLRRLCLRFAGIRAGQRDRLLLRRLRRRRRQNHRRWSRYGRRRCRRCLRCRCGRRLRCLYRQAGLQDRTRARDRRQRETQRKQEKSGRGANRNLGQQTGGAARPERSARDRTGKKRARVRLSRL